MHGGKIALQAKNPNAVTRLFSELLRGSGCGFWYDALYLATVVKTTCISTRVSELRKDLPRYNYEHKTHFVIEHEEREGRKHFYRLVEVQPQIELL
jgi:hypothetical protein